MIVDNFLADPERVRQAGLVADYEDWLGPDGEVYKRICRVDIPEMWEAVERAVGPVEKLGMAYRLNHSGELPNAAIHSDMGWGTHALVWFGCEGEGGTAFWRHKATGAERINPGDVALYEQIKNDWDDESKWEIVELVGVKFNRAVIYSSELFHSRYPFGAFGTDAATGRLTVVAFFSPEITDDPTSH